MYPKKMIKFVASDFAPFSLVSLSGFCAGAGSQTWQSVGVRWGSEFGCHPVVDCPVVGGAFVVLALPSVAITSGLARDEIFNQTMANQFVFGDTR